MSQKLGQTMVREQTRAAKLGSTLGASYLNADLTSAFISTTNDQMPAPSPTPQQPIGEMQGMAASTEANTARP